MSSYSLQLKALKLLLVLMILISLPLMSARASSPLSGTLNPSATTPVNWNGNATGPASLSQPTSCREGIDCDTFTLNVGGAAADWTGKVARIRIGWQLPATDYDLYILREFGGSQYIVARSTNNPSNSNSKYETADIYPSINGTGSYLVRVMYTAASVEDQYAGSASVAAVTQSACKLPGIIVLADLTGDSVDTSPGHDIESVSIAEPYTVGASKLVFTIKVSSLSSLSPNTIWRVYFRTPNIIGARYFVDMRTDTSGAVTYKYGTGDDTTLGDVDAGVYDVQKGTIKLVVSNNKIGSPMAGQYPEQRLEQLYAQVIVGPVLADSAPSRDVELSQATYTLVGNSSCTAARIAFVSNRDGNYEVYTANVDGSNVTRLTNNLAEEDSPSWSPDGTKLVFQSNRDGRNNIFVMNADGSNQTNLTPGTGDDHYPVWSPDGTKIVFESYRNGPNPEIYVINADGSNLTRLTNNTYDDYFPSWSPDGTKIIYSNNRAGIDIYVMNADGSNQTQLTDSLGYAIMPSWSPDGSKIAFVDYPNGSWEVYVMNADGSGKTRLTFNAVDEYFPRWSPDSLNLVCASWRDGNSEIYVMDDRGATQVNITNNPAIDAAPAWQP
ncbi:MAG TPA: hypothetical protein VF658_05470 [Pyrinomonadaceae bacterium]|jgi:Tol biopolymer transport system component